MNHDEDINNNSNNRAFEDILEARLSRRKLMKGGLGLAATAFIGGSGFVQAASASMRNGSNNLIDFEAVPVSGGGGIWPRISDDYEFQVLIPWGDPLEPGGPDYVQVDPNNPDASDFADLAERQIGQLGVGHDGMAFFPIDQHESDDDGRSKRGKRGEGNRHGLIAINHEFGSNDHVIGVPQGQLPISLDQVRRSQHAHGVSVVEVRQRGDEWKTRKSDYARRIHVNTPVAFSGPAAGSDYLKTPAGNIPMGTVNNCANGVTPWGTYVTCEENFNGYFGATNLRDTWTPTPGQNRYGFSASGFGYGWHTVDPRFDLSDPDYRNEENRFGWVVEIDPFNPHMPPVKHTALGRCKHEGAAFTTGKGGKVVAYMGDDQRFDYIYRYVSDDNWKSMRARGMSPLEKGTLYVARFADDGSGEWLELSMNNPVLASQFASDAEILVYTRLAADAVGATPMDRPEWTTVAPNGDVYCALTNNTRRTVADAANPTAPNTDGHIIKISDSKKHTGTDFKWDIFLVAADTRGSEDVFTDPDGLWADPDGRLFIQTDGGQPDGLNDQMLVVDTATGDLRRLLEGVASDEITGIATTPDRRTMFVNLQHPGNGNPSVTNFPVNNSFADGVTVPRDATLVIRRKDGGVVGF